MDALILAVFNALWQGAALIALVALALRAGLRRNATTACVVWSIAFVVVALLPALDLALARPAVAPVLAPVVAQPIVRGDARTTTTARTTPSTMTTTNAVPADVPVSAAPVASGMAVGEVVRAGAVRLGGAATVFARVWGLALLCAWALVAGALLVRLARGYAAVARMKREATPLDDPVVLARLRAAGHRRGAAVAQSRLVEVPCAVGFRRPMILVPAQLVASLDSDDLARVVLHESAHLQRYDDWLNALEQVVCALQFFQPALYAARRGIDFEREVACDDRVLAAAGEPLRYAECLARIVQRRVRGPRVAVAPGFVLRRPQVVGRVRRIVDRSRDASPRLRFAAVAATAMVLAATLGIARLQVPVVAAASAESLEVPAQLVQPSATAHAADAASHTAPRPVVRAQTVSKTAAKTAAKTAVNTVLKTTVTTTPTTTAKTVTQKTVTKVAAHAAPAAAFPNRAAVSPVAPSAPADPSDRAAGVTPRAAVTADEAVAVAPVAPVAVAARSAVQAAPTTPRAPEPPTAAARDGGDLLDAIDEAKYPHPSVDDLVALRTQGVSGDYVRRMNALVRPRPTLHDLISLAVQGVTPEYAAGLNRRLAAAPCSDQIVAVRVQGVSIAWLDGLAALGYTKLSADDAVALAVQGVSVAWVRGLIDAGLHNLTPSQLVALRVQGVDGSFVRRVTRGKTLDADELIRLKVAGF
jgi:beta-lactamase regulating signal transducer with metallopeptidase domain